MEFKYYLRILFKRKWAALLILLISTLIPLLLAVSSKKIYGTAAKFVINKKDTQSLFSSMLHEKYGELAVLESTGVYTDYLEIAKDESLYLKVINKMGLDAEPGSFHLSTWPFLYFLAHAQEEGVNVEQVSDSDIYTITGYASSAEKAAAIANQLLAEFIISNQEMIRGQADSFLTIVENRFKQVKEEVAAVEAEKAQFIQAGEISGEYDKQILAINTDISTLEYDSHKIEVKLKALDKTQQKILATIKSTPEFNLSNKTDTLDTSIVAAKNSLADLLVKLAAKKNELKENHPDIIALKNQIEAAKKILVSENRKYFSSEQETRNSLYDSLVSLYANNEIDKIEHQLFVEMTAQNVREKQAKVRTLKEQGVKVTQFDDKIMQLKKYVNSYMDTIEALKRVKQMQVSNVSVIRYADPKIDGTKAYFPSWKKVLLFIGFLGATLAFFGTLFMEYIDDTWSDPGQLADTDFGSPVCVVPRGKNTTIDHAVILARMPPDPDASALTPGGRNPVSESLISKNIWELLSSVCVAAEPSKMIAITSTLPGEGKSTIGFLLAQAFAEKGEKVLFVDANLADPALGSYFKENPNQGDHLSSLFRETPDLDGMTVKTLGQNLDLLSGPKLHYPASILYLERIVTGLKTSSGIERYTRVILDVAGMQGHGEGWNLLVLADLVIFVVALKAAKRSLTQQCFEQLKQLKSPQQIKLVVNKAW